MPRSKQQQKTGKTTHRSEAALAETVEANSQGDTSAKPASKKKAAAKKSTGSNATATAVSKAVTKKKAAAKEEAAPTKPPKYGRTQALYDALKEPRTRAELIDEVDRLYTEAGGESNRNGAHATVTIHVPALLYFGAITEHQGRLSLK